VTAIRKSSLADTHPEIAAQADGWDPTTVATFSHSKVNWKCSFGHRWNATVASRSAGNGCPACSGKAVLAGFNDLASVNPELAAEADGWDPTTLTVSSGKKVGWKCKLGHKWEAIVRSRSSGTGCPVCAGQAVLAGYNDVATINPELAAEADGWNPTTLSPFSHSKVNWKCKLGHQWTASVAKRSRGNGCPVCAGRSVLVGFNDLASVNPELAAEADGWDPTTLTVSSGKKVGWKCKLGHQWTVPVSGRTGRGRGCPICSNQKVLVGFNDLASINPELAAQADGWDPTTISVGTNKKTSWKCKLGHQWAASVANRSKGSGCPVCAGQTVLVGFNDLATINPELAAEADGWDPTTVTPGSDKKVAWRCELGHKWAALVGERNSGRGCPTCATFGFDPNKPSFLYFLDNFDLHMYQIGITNFPDDRLGSHKRRGWEFIELRGPMDGHLTQQLETSCLHALEKRGAIFGNKAGIEKFDGYSEAWTKSSLNVTSIKQMLDWVYEDEEIHRG
jgi:hypothetical protein